MAISTVCLRTVALAIAVLVTPIAEAAAQGRDGKAGCLSFEDCGNFGTPNGWSGGPISTIGRDISVAHSGNASGRIARDANSREASSTLLMNLPADIEGKMIELRGWLKLEGVDGSAALWLRQDGLNGMISLANMRDQKLSGTADWKQYSISLPIDPGTRTIAFGALLVGTGRVWVDDLELLVDGRPFTEAPQRIRPKTAIDTDLEFRGGSRIQSIPLSPLQVENLVTLCKVWGFVKYRHPKVTAAEVNWDFELFRALPPVLAARDRASANAAIEAWLAGLGDPPPCKPCAQEPDSVQLKPRLAWIADRSRLGDTLAQRLAMIHERRDADDEQYYVQRTGEGLKTPDLSNEQSYARPDVPDAGYRLLAVFRFWNIIESWFPYRDVMGEDWDRVLASFIPRVFAASTAKGYALEMMQLVARVHDTHANLWSSIALRPPVGDCYFPARLQFVDRQFVVRELPDSLRGAGLLPGDAIVAIDGVPVESRISNWLPYYGASNETAARRDIARVLTYGSCGPVRVLRDRAGAREEVTLQRTTPVSRNTNWTHDRPSQTFVRLSDDLAYLKLSSVRLDDVDDYVRRAQGARVLLIDIRNYPAAFVVFALGQHLVPTKTRFATFTAPDFANPGLFRWAPTETLEPREPRFTGKVVVLVDEMSQSQSEYTALAFRSAPDAIVVGSTTAGADGNIVRIPLPGGLSAMISGLGVFTADRKPTQRVGIIPDVVVRPTRAGLAAGRDEVIEAAVRRSLGRALTAAEMSGFKLGSR